MGVFSGQAALRDAGTAKLPKASAQRPDTQSFGDFRYRKMGNPSICEALVPHDKLELSIR